MPVATRDPASRQTRARLLGLLADGRFHSGQELAGVTGVSRAAVWKHMRMLRRRGLDIFAVSGRGYCLARPLDLLDADRIRRRLDPQATGRIRTVAVHLELASTNRYLLEQLPPEAADGHVCLAEYQSAGRGRHGQRWLSPLGAGLYLSIGWRVDGMPEPLTGLSLAAGVAAVRALESCGLRGVKLKWPNDLLAGGGKLGGILLQVRGEITGACLWVLGIGLNVRLPRQAAAEIGQPVADLAQLAAAVPPRDELAAALINELVQCLTTYPETGFGPWLRDWRRHDCMSGHEVRLLMGPRSVSGRMLGVDDAGALLLSVNGSVRRYASGELSLRRAS